MASQATPPNSNHEKPLDTMVYDVARDINGQNKEQDQEKAKHFFREVHRREKGDKGKMSKWTKKLWAEMKLVGHDVEELIGCVADLAVV